MSAQVAPAPPSRPLSGGRKAQKSASAQQQSTPDMAGAGKAASRPSRLQFLLDIAHATFNQQTSPNATQIDALRRILSAVPLDELGVAEQAQQQQQQQQQQEPPLARLAEEHSSAMSSRSSTPSLTDGPQTMLSRALDEAEAGARAAAGAVSSRQHRPPITYLLIHEDERVSLGIFCLPAGACIPLHNHPGMTVLSRVLYGQMHVSSYDWLEHATAAGTAAAAAAEGQQQQQQQEPPQQQQQQEQQHAAGDEALPRPARVVLDQTLAGGDPPAVLFPTAGGNIHQFTALTDCAVLDLMSPPYSSDDGRDCTYYRVLPRSSPLAAHAPEGAVILDSYEPPADFVINQGEYKGMQPQPKATPLFAGTSLFPAAGAGSRSGTVSPASSSGTLASSELGPQVPQQSPSPGTPVAGSPTSSNSLASELTGGPGGSSLPSSMPSPRARPGPQAQLECAALRPGRQRVC